MHPPAHCSRACSTRAHVCFSFIVAAGCTCSIALLAHGYLRSIDALLAHGHLDRALPVCDAARWALGAVLHTPIDKLLLERLHRSALLRFRGHLSRRTAQAERVGERNLAKGFDSVDIPNLHSIHRRASHRDARAAIVDGRRRRGAGHHAHVERESGGDEGESHYCGFEKNFVPQRFCGQPELCFGNSQETSQVQCRDANGRTGTTEGI